MIKMVLFWINKQNYYWVFCLNPRLEAKWDSRGGPTPLISRLLEARLQLLKELFFWFGLVSSGLVPWFPLFITTQILGPENEMKWGWDKESEALLFEAIWISVVQKW